ncbi:phosphopantetheine-binding protein [Cellvibrio sp.]|uniref:phosphopantetheine-binding protein n=1 Tax=Cellvibrio sp. TaxID=1965322 RepID=UPI0039648BBE
MQSVPEQELAALLVAALDLEDVDAVSINPEAPLFDPSDTNSLGLDSIDALEISLAIAKQYKVQLKADDQNNRSIFRSLRSLSDYIQANRA